MLGVPSRSWLCLLSSSETHAAAHCDRTIPPNLPTAGGIGEWSLKLVCARTTGNAELNSESLGPPVRIGGPIVPSTRPLRATDYATVVIWLPEISNDLEVVRLL